MTPTTTQKKPPRSQWFLALGENADYAPTIIHALADQKLLVYPKKITLYQRGERVLDFLKPRSQWPPLGLYCDQLHAADHFHPRRGDGSYIKSPKTSEDEFWFKQSFANFIKATSTNDQSRLQILVIGISRWIEDLLRRAVLQHGNGKVDLFAVNLWHPSGIRVKHYHSPLQLNGSVEPTVIDLGDARWIDQNGCLNRYALRVFRPDYKNDRSSGGSFYQARLTMKFIFKALLRVRMTKRSLVMSFITWELRLLSPNPLRCRSYKRITSGRFTLMRNACTYPKTSVHCSPGFWYAKPPIEKPISPRTEPLKTRATFGFAISIRSA